jgi:hypothetical protein
MDEAFLRLKESKLRAARGHFRKMRRAQSDFRFRAVLPLIRGAVLVGVRAAFLRRTGVPPVRHPSTVRGCPQDHASAALSEGPNQFTGLKPRPSAFSLPETLRQCLWWYHQGTDEVPRPCPARQRRGFFMRIVADGQPNQTSRLLGSGQSRGGHLGGGKEGGASCQAPFSNSGVL